MKYGADVNELPPSDLDLYDMGVRPPTDAVLIEAITAGSSEMVELLLDEGTNPSIIGRCGMTSFGVAHHLKADLC